jgi:hypothetical protein
MRQRVRLIAWVTRTGRRRRIRLYEAWVNMRGRVRGGKSTQGKKHWINLGIGFASWPEFRAWALQAGFRKGVELDRIDNTKGYFPDNLQWLPKVEHSRKSALNHKLGCRCPACAYRRENNGVQSWRLI